MLMKKFVAATSREAMQKMKNELGPDALVISNRKVGSGVEILAMAENAVESLALHAAPAPATPAAPPPGWSTARQGQALPQAAPRAAPAPAAATVPRYAAPQPRPAQRGATRPALRAPARATAAPRQPEQPYQTLKDFAPRVEAAAPAGVGADAYAANPFAAMPALRPAAPAAPVRAPAPAPAVAQSPVRAPIQAPPQAAPVAPPRAAAAAPAAAAPAAFQGEERLLGEFKAMKALLQSQLAGLAFRDMSERRPLALKLWREMADAGFSASITRAITGKLPHDLGEAQARKWLGEVLAHNLHCADPARDLVEAGGTYALVGPTGVGKTTTVAKLAARCVVKYGALSLGLVTTDSYRIGAFDQLSIYGKILGVQVHSAQSYTELEATLATLRGKRLVLIDTTGMGQRDNRLAEQINLLGLPEIRRVLLLNAAAQAETLEDVARAYQGKAAGARPLAGVIFSKIDEAAKLGPVLDTAMRHLLDVYYVSNGQRVPEDLHPAKAQVLVHRALKAGADPVFALRDDELPLRAMSGINGYADAVDAGRHA
jgi:flagellar biosynthesis protein FlhF